MFVGFVDGKGSHRQEIFSERFGDSMGKLLRDKRSLMIVGWTVAGQFPQLWKWELGGERKREIMNSVSKMLIFEKSVEIARKKLDKHTEIWESLGQSHESGGTCPGFCKRCSKVWMTCCLQPFHKATEVTEMYNFHVCHEQGACMYFVMGMSGSMYFYISFFPPKRKSTIQNTTKQCRLMKWCCRAVREGWPASLHPNCPNISTGCRYPSSVTVSPTITNEFPPLLPFHHKMLSWSFIVLNNSALAPHLHIPFSKTKSLHLFIKKYDTNSIDKAYLLGAVPPPHLNQYEA